MKPMSRYERLTAQGLDRIYGTQDPSWLADCRRPIGTTALAVDFYDGAERKKPMEDQAVRLPDGQTGWVGGARWCVAIMLWTGERWRRQRRISGPMRHKRAIERLYEESQRRGIEVRP